MTKKNGLKKNEPSKNTEIIQVSDIAERLDELTECFNENLGGTEFNVRSFQALKIPAGGSTMWSIQTLEDEQAVKQITGIIIARQPGIKLLWDQGEPSGQPPICVGYKNRGEGTPGGNCRTCDFNKFGSKINPDGSTGKGKACKDVYQVFFLMAGDLMPVRLPLPVMSIPRITDYLILLTRGLKKSHDVVTSVSLEKATNSQGQPYARAKFSFVRDLNADEKPIVESYRKMFNTILDTATRGYQLIDGTEYDGE